MTADPITASFECAAERCEDLTPHVYGRLFREHPELEPFFVMDDTGAARGSMLAWVTTALLDYKSDQAFGLNLIRAEVVNHNGMGVAPDQFALFFTTLAATLRDLLGTAWTPAMATAWTALLTDLNAVVQNPG